MTQAVIQAAGLSKAYRIGALEQRAESLVGALAGVIRSPARNLRRLRRLTRFDGADAESEDVVWALRDVSLQVEQGEVLGIIGRNGAGKSTLLKVLAGITEPTAGQAAIRGRVASLLEVGTGFHPDLTGRENIFLNGTILGMSKSEVSRKFNEIVAFAEVERFLDTPIKWYSSGMAVRLAFAVAAHLEVDILLVDEVLAVGDASFQRRCMGRMEDLASSGRTVLFVSHNMAAITHLCSRAVCIQDGRVISRGTSLEVVEQYLAGVRQERNSRSQEQHGASWAGNGMMRRVRLLSNDNTVSSLATGQSFSMEVEIWAGEWVVEGLSFGFQVSDLKGRDVFGTNMLQYGSRVRPSEGPVIVVARIDELLLAPGTYSVSLFLGGGAGKDLEIIRDAFFFDVVWPAGSDAMAPPQEQWGPLFMPVHWETRPKETGREG